MPVFQVSPPRPPGFATLARRISAWTTNLLATGIIVVLALVVGKQLIAWWRVEPNEVSTPPAASRLPLADLGADGPLELNFGQLPYQIQRRSIRGDHQAATDSLVAACRELAGSDPAALPNFGPAEARLLALTAKLPPVAEGPGGVQVFASPDALPLVVATLAVPTPNPVQPGGEVQSQVHAAQGFSPVPEPIGQAGSQLGAGQRRVVVWGLAAPTAEGAWNLYVAHAGRNRATATPSHDAASPQERDSPREAVPIPPGSQRTLAVWDTHGGGLSAFAGSGQAEDWAAFFSAWFSRQSWTVLEDWQPFAGCWHARFARGKGSGRATVDVQIGADGAAGLVGFISIAGAEPSAGK